MFFHKLKKRKKSTINFNIDIIITNLFNVVQAFNLGILKWKIFINVKIKCTQN